MNVFIANSLTDFWRYASLFLGFFDFLHFAQVCLLLFTPWIWHSWQKKVAPPPAHAGGRDEIIPINML